MARLYTWVGLSFRRAGMPIALQFEGLRLESLLLFGGVPIVRIIVLGSLYLGVPCFWILQFQG